MRIERFYDFINEEFSKNDPIPEITRDNDKLGIIFIGTPGSGKSTFISNFIMPRNRNMKKFSTDDISLLYTKDPKIYYKSSSSLNSGRLHTYIKSGRNFIYDTTGIHDANVFKVCKNARENGYKIIFIQILVDLETSKKQNIKRRDSGGHFVDETYIDFVYSRISSTVKDYNNLLKPDNFYIVFNKEGKYKYFKYDNGKLLRRKMDKYIPVVKSSRITESKVDDKINYLWQFFHEIKDDGLDVTINKGEDSSFYDGKFKKYIIAKISDPNNIYKSNHESCHLFDPSGPGVLGKSDIPQMQSLIDSLNANFITPRRISGGKDFITMYFDRYSDRSPGGIMI